MLLFCLGLFGVIARRNAPGDLYVARVDAERGEPGAGGVLAFNNDLNGQVMVFFVITVAAAEVAVGLALIVALYRRRQTAQVAHLNTLKL
jgi:NADH-quinone oxidoreductase subunit K